MTATTKAATKTSRRALPEGWRIITGGRPQDAARKVSAPAAWKLKATMIVGAGADDAAGSAR